MINFLVRKFVKDYENIKNAAVRTSYGLLASVVGIICNLILFLVKLIIGIVLNSISVTADAFNNLSDATSSIIGFVGTKLANRPADKEHPFGHGRYEHVTALIVAFLVFEVGVTCLKSSFVKILHPEPVDFQFVLVIILVLSILLKLWLALFNRKLGNRVDSSILKATSTDAFGDVGITSATVVSIMVNRFAGINIDGYIGTVVSLFVLWSAVGIIKETIQPLIGVAVSVEDYERITDFVEGYDLIVGSHDLIVHKYGPANTMATIHVEVPHTMEMDKAHDVIDQIEREAKEKLNILLVIHMDPVAVDDDAAMKAKGLLVDVVKKLNEDASVHDFRMVKGDYDSKLIFDLVVPHDYSITQQNAIIEQIRDCMKTQEERFDCIITLEHGYLEDIRKNECNKDSKDKKSKRKKKSDE
ncbi:MAG: cation transporter [Clostridium sp.]|nr:cation transporter [Clostridium sp.]